MPSLLRTEAVERAATITVTQMLVSLDLSGDDLTSFDSKSVIDFDATPGQNSFVDFKGAHLESAQLNGQELDPSTLDDGRLPLAGLGAHNQLVIEGTMSYSSDGEGLHRHVDAADGAVYLYAMSFLDAAPRWFACFDQPDLKAPYRIDVIAPPEWTVWGNGPASQVSQGRWVIEQPCPLASYFVTLAAGPWAVVRDEHNGMPLALLGRQSLAGELRREAPDILATTKTSFDAYRQVFDQPYPYGCYTQAFVPDFNAGAMENPACITLRDQYLLRGRPTAADRAQRAGTIAHEMAHQWFGDLVTMRWWDDLWLNESFAEYLGHKVISENTGYDLWTQFGIIRKDWGFVADQSPSTHPVAANGADDAQAALADFDGISYAKGASLLRQLAFAMGDGVFFAGLNAYIDAHRFGNASLADLMAAWRSIGATGLDEFAQAWLATCGMDKISVRPNRAVLVVEGGRSDAVVSPISLEVAALGRDASLLDCFNLRVNAPGELALPPVSERVAVMVPDAGDTCWARIRPSSWQLPPIAKIESSSTRVVLYNAIRDGLRAGELPVGDALTLLIDGLPGEPNDDIAAAMARFAIQAAGIFSPWDLRGGRMAQVSALLAKMMGQAEPGGDRAMIMARALADSSCDTDMLESWLTHPPAGLRPDPALRWAVVTRLVALGAPEDIIDDELAHDPQGADQAGGARAAAPTRIAKQAALDALLQPGSRRAYELYAIAEQIWQVGQEGLCASFAPLWFTGIGATSAFRQGWSLAKVAALSFPFVPAEPGMLDLAKTALLGIDDQRLRRELNNGIWQLGRILQAWGAVGSTTISQ